MVCCLVLVVLVAVGCLSGTQKPESTGSLEWSICPLPGQGKRQCAMLSVPVDWSQPDGKRTEIAVSRNPAANPEARIGALVWNPGGPGLTGRYVPSPRLPAELTERFDLIGFDPRGVGRSNRFDCGNTPKEFDRVNRADDAAALSQQAVKDIDAAATAWADRCKARYGQLIGHLGTWQVIQDVDAIRRALGEDTISLLTLSYGTVLAQAYLERYPQHVRAAVLDGVADPAVGGAVLAARDSITEDELQDEGSERERLASALKRSLAGFAPWCSARPQQCPIAADPIGKVVDAAHLEQGDSERSETVQTAAAVAGEQPGVWKPFAQAVAAAAADPDDGTALEGIAAEDWPKALREEFASAQGGTTAKLGIICNDAAWPGTTGELLRRFSEAARTTGVTSSSVHDYLACPHWPRPDKPLGTMAAPEGLPILMINAERDPRTSLSGAQRVARRFHADLLTVAGKEHGTTLSGTPCVNKALLDFLFHRHASTTHNCK